MRIVEKCYLLYVKLSDEDIKVNKFAIYRSDTGLYYYKYADTMEALAGTGFEDIITEEQLPVVFDGRGGYYRFKEDDYKFVKLVETEEEVPLTLEEMFYKNHPGFKLGWMSPEGDTYSCSYTNHTKCAKILAAKFFPKSKYPESALDRGGWLKIIDSWDGTERQHGQFVFTDRGEITKKQADRLFDLGLYENDEVKKLIAASENNW